MEGGATMLERSHSTPGLLPLLLRFLLFLFLLPQLTAHQSVLHCRVEARRTRGREGERQKGRVDWTPRAAGRGGRWGVERDGRRCGTAQGMMVGTRNSS